MRDDLIPTLAARVTAEKNENEPEIQAHTNPVYVGANESTIFDPAARSRLADRWEAELKYFRSANLRFPTQTRKAEFFRDAEKALAVLRQ